MAYWETVDQNPSAPEHELKFANIWKALPKIVFSKTLETVEGNARLVREDAVEEATKLNEQPGRDLAVGGAALASTFIKLDLVETRTFGSRVVYLRYRRARPGAA
jgi:dihydrofolate reductase